MSHFSIPKSNYFNRKKELHKKNEGFKRIKKGCKGLQNILTPMPVFNTKTAVFR